MKRTRTTVLEQGECRATVSDQLISVDGINIERIGSRVRELGELSNYLSVLNAVINEIEVESNRHPVPVHDAVLSTDSTTITHRDLMTIRRALRCALSSEHKQWDMERVSELFGHLLSFSANHTDSVSYRITVEE